jgi:hypothetical protein
LSPSSPWQAINPWSPTDEDEPRFHWQDPHHSNESPWKPKEVLLGDDLILILDAD